MPMPDPSRPRTAPPPHHAAPGRTVAAPPKHGPWHLGAQQGQALVLMPGQMYFGGRASALRTLLGSCVAITLWHPARKIGGMCHFLLPKRERRAGAPLDGRYGDESVEAMMTMLRLTDTDPADYHAHLYGGADTMPEGGTLRFNVGERNIEQGWSLIDHFGFQLQGVDVGEDIPRTVNLTLATGQVDMRRGTGRAPSELSSPALAAAATAPMPLDPAPAPFASTLPMPFAATAPAPFAASSTMPLSPAAAPVVRAGLPTIGQPLKLDFGAPPSVRPTTRKSGP